MARYAIPSDNAFGVSVATSRCWPSASGAITSSPPRCGRRMVRGAHAGGVRRRAGARHRGADGPLVPRLRQLGHLRHRSASTSSIARRTRGRRSRRGREAREFASARPSRCSGRSRCTTRSRRRAVPAGTAAHRDGRQRRPQLRQEGRQYGPAARSAGATPRSTPPPCRWRGAWPHRRRRRAGGSARTRSGSSRARRSRESSAANARRRPDDDSDRRNRRASARV